MVISSLRTVDTNDFEDDDVKYLVRNCPALRSLNLDTSYGDVQQVVTEVGLTYIADSCPCLEEFTYNRIRDPDKSQEYYTRTAAALMNILHRCTNLTKVSLRHDALHSVDLNELCQFGYLFDYLHVGWDDHHHSAESVSKLLSSCINLDDLEYHGDDGENPLVITAGSCSLLRNLELVSLSEATSVTMLNGFSRSCKHLNKLSLHSIKLSVAAMRCIAGMEALKHLTIEYCDNSTDAVFRILAQMSLVSLDISVDEDEEDEDEEDGVTEAFLLSFRGANISRTLESFHIDISTDNWTADDMQVALAFASCPRLTSLSVRGWGSACVFGQYGVEGLRALAISCPLLSDVSLRLSVSGLFCLGALCPHLKTCKSPRIPGDTTIHDLRIVFPLVKWSLT
jgi:hypothetical protein